MIRARDARKGHAFRLREERPPGQSPLRGCSHAPQPRLAARVQSAAAAGWLRASFCGPVPPPTPRITNLAALTLKGAPATIRPTSEPRREAPVRTAIHSTLCGREQGLRAVPPKEQPPWNLSGTRDRKGDDSLESGRGARNRRNRSTDGVGGPESGPRNLSGPHDRQGHDGNGAARKRMDPVTW